MKDRIKLFIINLLQKAGEVVNKVLTMEISKRITLGVSIVIASITYIYLIGDGNNGVFGSVIAALLNVLGLFIIVPNIDTLNKAAMKIAVELLKASAAIISWYEVNIFYTIGIHQLNNTQKAVFTVCVFIDIMYIVSMSIALYKIIKRIIDFVMSKINLDAIENGTKTIDEIAKNLASIAGMMIVVYEFFKPLIKSIFGL